MEAQERESQRPQSWVRATLGLGRRSPDPSASDVTTTLGDGYPFHLTLCSANCPECMDSRAVLTSKTTIPNSEDLCRLRGSLNYATTGQWLELGRKSGNNYTLSFSRMTAVHLLNQNSHKRTVVSEEEEHIRGRRMVLTWAAQQTHSGAFKTTEIWVPPCFLAWGVAWLRARVQAHWVIPMHRKDPERTPVRGKGPRATPRRPNLAYLRL